MSHLFCQSLNAELVLHPAILQTLPLTLNSLSLICVLIFFSQNENWAADVNSFLWEHSQVSTIVTTPHLDYQS